jgi:hypothetical protein
LTKAGSFNKKEANLIIKLDESGDSDIKDIIRNLDDNKQAYKSNYRVKAKKEINKYNYKKSEKVNFYINHLDSC